MTEEEQTTSEIEMEEKPLTREKIEEAILQKIEE